MKIDAIVNGDWISKNDGHTDQHEIQYLYDVNVSAAPDIADHEDQEIMNGITEVVAEKVQKDILSEARAFEEDVPEDWSYQTNAQTDTHSFLGTANPGQVTSHHAVSSKININTDFLGRPMAALMLDSRPIALGIVHAVAMDVLSLIKEKPVESTLRSSDGDFQIDIAA